MTEAYLLAAVRTPIGVGKQGGALAEYAPVDLGAVVLSAVVDRAGIEPGKVDDVVWGCVTPIGDQGANIARLSVLKAGFPVHVPGVTLNRMCGSSQQAVHFAAQEVLSGDMDVVIAGGIEMMSNQAIGADWPEQWPDDFPYDLVHQGTSAELMAEKWELTREELDDYAYHSHWKAMQAIEKARFDSQILPLKNGNGSLVKTDQGVRIPPDREKMGSLPPAFKQDGVITAGNSSQISDGAAALVIASPKIVGRYNLNPRARIVSRIVIGSDPVLTLDGPITATKLALDRAGLDLSDVDVIEINEAFASVVLAWQKELGVDMQRVNPNGGAIALGHPLGATGAVLMTKLLNELERTGGKFGLQTMCIGHGMATATVIERL